MISCKPGAESIGLRPAELSASEALGELRAGRLTSAELTASGAARIAARDPEVLAWSHFDRDAAMAQAGQRDRSDARALNGLPIGIKDVILTEDMPTGYNSSLYADFAPRIDAACVAVLRAAGAVIMGKTATVEFGATGRSANTRNPLDPSRTPGGSSSGSAAAVADGHVAMALGTQTGGSIIRPASYCGVFGFKPTWGLVSTEGCKAFAPSLDTVGWFARTAADLSLILDVLDPPAAASERTGRIGVYHGPHWAEASPETRSGMALAEHRLRGLGLAVCPLPVFADLDGLPAAHVTIMRGEGRASFLAQHRLGAADLHPSIAAMAEPATFQSRVALVQAYDLAARARARFDQLAASFDAVLAPSVTGEAPVGLASTGDYLFNGVWTLLGGPAVNVPMTVGSRGMPVGVTLTGPRFADRGVLAVAEALEAASAGQRGRHDH